MVASIEGESDVKRKIGELPACKVSVFPIAPHHGLPPNHVFESRSFNDETRSINCDEVCFDPLSIELSAEQKEYLRFILYALHHSRRLQAERTLQRYRDLIDQAEHSIAAELKLRSGEHQHVQK
jgi:hypothetical protein